MIRVEDIDQGAQGQTSQSLLADVSEQLQAQVSDTFLGISNVDPEDTQDPCFLYPLLCWLS